MSREHLALIGSIGLVVAVPSLARSNLETRSLVALRALPVAVVDTENESLREARLKALARVIAKVGKNDQGAAALITLGNAESRFATYVAEGCLVIPKGAAHCDKGKARSYWQVHSWCAEGWATAPGSTESLEPFAKCALKHYQWAKARCKARSQDPELGGFSAYKQGRCDWPGAVPRLAEYKRTLRKLQTLD